ncbi:hybrid sensor histidine kinase/response regulator [Rhizobium sp. CFBP 8762]|uniref:hybrid sensor histidine kinase/response regulator n=1 Tax=Rhizobium sp. CFBP 8762 TaxID=2775279 RepID=UPI0018D798EA|nr:response regulator [Rhizobium sp. CFBP 8762]
MLRAPELLNLDASALFNASPNPYLVLDTSYTILGMNEAYLDVTQRRRDDITGQHLFDVFPSDPQSDSGRMLRTSLQKVVETERRDVLPLIPYPVETADGVMEDRYWSATHTPLFDSDGKLCHILQHTVDVTELHRLRTHASISMQAEADVMKRAIAVQMENMVLGAERNDLRTVFEQALSFMAVLNGADHAVAIANTAFKSLVGQDAVMGMPFARLLPEANGHDLIHALDDVFRTARSSARKSLKIVVPAQPGGEPVERHIDVVLQPLLDESGETKGIFVQGNDLTEQKNAERAAIDSEGRFRLLAQSIPNHTWIASRDGALEWVNDQTYAYTGSRPGSINSGYWKSLIHPGDLNNTLQSWQESVESGSDLQMEARIRRYDGIYRWHLIRATALFDESGQVRRWVGTNTDIEDRKNVESSLTAVNSTLEERVAERTQQLIETQEALRHSQKMEAIGNIAGGIAHDFNNLLQVVGGNLQLLLKDVAGRDREEQRIRNALQGVTRGAKLASQLLAFGRRQPLEPKVVNIGRLVRNMDDMLRRTIGEAIEIETVIAGGLWNTLIDPGNLENALLNLVINSRDAMENHGKLTIEAGNTYLDDTYSRTHHEVTPGQYVMLAVSDTGSGIPPELLEAVFDPFFSTKPEGKGTGLGLSMVYGFVKQSGGHIKIYSEVGSGTTIKLYVPRSLETEDLVSETETGPATGGNETILVAEDDDAVRETTVALLTDLGYRVLKARDAQSALNIIESGLAIDLLFTDVIMPGTLKSPELARKAKARLPNIGVLFTSGYTENSIVHGGRLDAGVNLLSKPYTREALARKIRHVLHATAMETVEAPAEASPDTPAPTLQQEAARRRILVCEDEPLILINTVDMLEEMGFEVLEASSGSAALTLLKTEVVDILISDVGLPDMSGVELTRTALTLKRDLAVIFATGHRAVSGAEDLTQAALLVKPFDMASLKAAISQAVTAVS